MGNLQFRRMTPTRREKFQGHPGKKRCVFWRERRRMVCSTRRLQQSVMKEPRSSKPQTCECFCANCRCQWHLHQSCTDEGKHIVQLRSYVDGKKRPHVLWEERTWCRKPPRPIQRHDAFWERGAWQVGPRAELLSQMFARLATFSNSNRGNIVAI